MYRVNVSPLSVNRKADRFAGAQDVLQRRWPATCTTFDAMPIRTLILPCCLCALAAAAERRNAARSSATGRCTIFSSPMPIAHLRTGRTLTPTIRWVRLPMRPRICSANSTACTFCSREFFTHEQHFFTDHKLAPDPAVKRKFDAALDAARRLAARAPQNPDCQFATILANGLHSDYMALIETRYAASFQEMKASRILAERLLAAHPEMYDAWIAIGVENYMLSVKPLPLRWLLRLAGGETDRAVGIEKLKLAAEKGHYLAPFAKLLLAVAALRDHNTWRARTLLEGLVREYPHNPLYAQELARLQPGAAAAGGMGSALW